MAETPGPDDVALTPAQEARVRRLLAEARHEEPMPAEVVARLDDVLAGLRAGSVPEERETTGDAGSAPAPVVDLAVRRRSRWTKALVAAAAVVAVGISVPQVMPQLMAQLQGSDEQAASSGEEEPAQGGAADDGQAQEGAPDESGAARGQAQAPAAGPGLPVVRADSFRSDVALLRTAPWASGELAVGGDRARTQARWKRCPRSLDRGEVAIAVQYAGRPAVVVYTPLAGDRERASLYGCGASQPWRQVTLPAR